MGAQEESDESMHSTRPPPKINDAPPDGGTVAWLQVLGGFFIFFNSWCVTRPYVLNDLTSRKRGIVNTFGAFQSFYESSLLENESASTISWIGTFQAFLLIALSIFSGPIFDQGYARELFWVGSFLSVFGLMMSSLATKYYQLFLSQGLCVGIGGGCLFLPCVAVVSTYFTTKRSLAIGIVASGGSVGSTIYPIVFRRLQPSIGFPWTIRVIAFIALGCLLASISIMKSRLSPSGKARKLVDLAAFKSIPYAVFTAGLFFVFVGLYVPIFDVVVNAQIGSHVNEDMSFYILSILNAASAFGRVIPGQLSDLYGSLEVIIVCTFCSAIFAYGWIGIHNLGGSIGFAIVYGFMSGAVVSVQASVIASLVPDVRYIGTWMGMALFVAGLGILIGSPIAGVLVTSGTKGFVDPFIFSGTFTMTGGILFCIAWIYKRRSIKA
jgi:MFS family permease